MSPRFGLAAAVFACCTLFGRLLTAQSATPTRLDIWGEDGNRAAWLEQHGRTVSRRQAVVVAPADSFPEGWQQALADSLDRGVAALRRLIGAPYRWQRIAERPVKFYLSPGSFVSHGTGRDIVFISLPRVRDGKAPYLHEASHELLRPRARFPGSRRADTPAAADSARDDARMPLWLFEGFPDYLALTVAAAEGLHEGDVFDIGGLAAVDSVCAARANASASRAELLRVVGASGRLEALFTTERRRVAPAFYACAQSMSKYLVARIGVRRVVALFPAITTGSWARDIERAAGMSLAELRRRWLEQLGLRAP